MNLNGEKYVRFNDCNSEDSFSLNGHSKSRLFQLRKPSLGPFLGGLRRGLDRGSERIKSLKRWSFNGPSKEKILDPQEAFLQTWNKIVVLTSVIAVSLDPLFFYIPVHDSTKFCLSLDNNLEIIACVFRSFIDIFYVYHIFLKFRTGFIDPSSRVFGRGELVDDSKAIAKRYLRSYFIIDILSILPLPQMVVVLISDKSLVTKELLKIVIFSQYVPRLLRIYPLYVEVTRTSGIFTKTPWAGAALNLFLYMLASHVLGAFWYLFSVERKDNCWRNECRKNGCDLRDLYCGGPPPGNLSFLNTTCQPVEAKNTNDFDFGIALDALQSGVTEHGAFMKKFFYCFWWGLRNLSSLGQNLKTSAYVEEILFAIFVSVIGLILFALLIGNMQKYLESITVREQEMGVKRRDAEQWMSHRMLPKDLRKRIRLHEQYKWQENRGVEEESLIRNLPKDLQRDIKRHLCLALLKKVPMIEKMNEQLLDAICSRLKPVLYTAKSYIFREGDPADEMLFIMRGNIRTKTNNGERTCLTVGDFCGEELLTWALDPKSSSSLPLSTRKVKAVKDVEAFSLLPEDLKIITSQFRRFFHSKQLQHTFRFFSPQWRTWGAGFIQAAWRRYYRRKIEKSLKEAEDGRQEVLSSEIGDRLSLGATIYASRFASNMMGNLRRNDPPNTMSSPRLPNPSPRLPYLLPQKPAEPDFSAENHS